MFNNAGFRFAGESVTGLVRKHNEDSFLISAPGGRSTALAAVADGVGGHRHGEIVSYICCRDLGGAFSLCSDAELLSEGGAEDFLVETVNSINRRIFKINYDEFTAHPMSCTLVAVLFTPREAVMLNVGDSRFYLVRPGGAVEQISTDHTLANEKAAAPEVKKKFPWASNILSRSIGTCYNLKFEVKRIPLEGGERFFMCSDGVYRDLTEERLAGILNSSDTPEHTVNRVMRSVLLEGAHDNTSVISVFPC